MKENTKDKILRIGAEIIHRKGFNHTGLQEILQAAKVPKGSFYNYFKSKEDFGLQVIDFYAEHFKGMVAGIVKEGALSPLGKVKGILDAFITFFGSKGYICGCPIGNLSQEMGDLSPVFRGKLKRAMDTMVGCYVELLAAAKEAGEISPDLDVMETSLFIVTSWQGALIRMKIEKGHKPLENHKRFIFDYVLKHP